MTRTSVVNGLVAADPFELLVLQDAQDLGLGQRRHVADFVQEQRAARGLLELADRAAGRRR